MYVLGIDVGTTGTKALLISADGSVVGRGYKSYGLITNAGGIVEQNANDWWDAVVFAVREATKNVQDKAAIVALSMSTQGASSLLVDAADEPIGNAITWMDSRSMAQKQQLEKINQNDEIYLKTGWPLNETLDATKLLWHKQKNKDAIKKAKKYISTIEYIQYKLTGAYVIDPTNAAIRQLMNLNTLSWDEEILSYIDVPRNIMPEIKMTGTMIDKLTADAAEQLGLSKHVQVYNGAHDQYCSALGAGAIKAGDMVLSTGTAWVLLGVTNSPMFTSSFIAPAHHIVKGLWGALASIQIGGVALEWLRKISNDSYELINKNTQNRMEKVKDVFFYPYFAGAKFPLWQQNAKASFLGLGLEHDQYDMYRVIMEGVAFQVKLCIEEYERNGALIDTLRMTGGATQSDVWMSIIAGVTGIDIYKSEQADAACCGAAAIAAVGAGVYKDYQEAVATLVKSKRVIPQDTNYFYKQKYDRYVQAWETAKNVYQ